ncbi:hypothetical protein C8Q70DRAFT_352552 [Cubamyces menziesii]|nr:hypothetical protein C8Q70DRAFT_352552 [Cubamyces menziesii]
MRAPSIPTWTTLAGDPTESSAAPSEDELQSLASQEMDEIASSPPPRQAIPTQKKQANMGPPTSRVTATNSNMQGSGTGVKHTSTANARRLLSGSDEEEELRPKKKRKRRIVDPQKGPAVAKPRVSLDGRHPTDTTRAGPSSQAPAPTPALPRSAIFNSEAAREARRQRRVTMDMGILASTSTQPSTSSQVSRPADKQASAGRPSASGLRLPRTNLADGVTPLQRAQARRKSTNLTGRPDGESSGAGPSRPRAPPSTAPAPAEIIEILDSDDEPPPPTQPAAVPKAPAPPPRPNIPRRTKYKTVPVPRYREDNGIIILDDDDDDPPPPPPATQSINHAKPTAPTSNTPLARDPSPVRQVPLRQSPSTSATRRPQTPVSAAVHAEVVSEPIAPEPDVQDIEMAEEEPPGPDMDTGFIPPEEPTVIDEQPIDSVATSEVNAEPDEPPDGDIAMDDTSVPPDLEVDLVQNPADITARSPSLPPVPPADEAPSEPLPASEGRSEEADEAVRDSPLLPRVAPSSSEDVTPSSVPPEPLLASVFFQPKPKDNATDLPPQSPQPQSQPALPASVLPSGPREGTESPVSAMLDPPLKDLSISDISPTSPQTGTPPPASPQPPVPTAKSPTPATAKSLPPSTAKLPSPATSNPSTPQRPKLPRVKIKGFLYGGPDGFFAPVHRLSQKRLSQASPLPQGSNVGASTSKAGSRASASLSPTASRVARAVKPPVSSSQDTRERSSSSTAPGGNLIETLPLDAAEKPRTEASEMLEVQSAAAVEAEVSMSRPKSPAKEAAPQVIAAADAPLVGRQEDHPMEDNVKETQEPAPGLEAHIPPGEVSAESLTGTSAAVPNSALESASAARAPTQVVSAEEEAQVSVSSVQAEAEEASGAERSDTPPPTEEQPQSRTLSQIIRKAVNEIAKNEIIDLTCDDSDNEPTTHTGPSTSKPTEQGMTVNVPLSE